jgi:hypothetical protein
MKPGTPESVSISTPQFGQANLSEDDDGTMRSTGRRFDLACCPSWPICNGAGHLHWRRCTCRSYVRLVDELEPVVWGEGEYSWIFLPRNDAEYWGAINTAINGGTWGDLKAVLDANPARYDWDDMVDPEEPPNLDEPVDPDSVPGYPDGDYPPMPGDLMLEWLPRELQEYGKYVQTTLNGDRLDIEDEASAQKVASKLKEMGYQLTRDDRLIRSLFR